MISKKWMSGGLMAAAVMLGAWSENRVAAPALQGQEAALATQGEDRCMSNDRTGQQPSWLVAQSEAPSPMGFGCPFNSYQCNEHCTFIHMRGGHCGGFLHATCQCFR
jgi:hypothetical protein